MNPETQTPKTENRTPNSEASEHLPQRGTQPSVHAFRLKYQGHFLTENGNLSYDPGQCVDVPNTWALTIGIDESYGNARELDYSRDADWVNNGPSNAPLPGDIVIWTGYPADPSFGHTAVALHKCDPEDLWALSQNFPDGSPVERLHFTYAGVAGWWHPFVLGTGGA